MLIILFLRLVLAGVFVVSGAAKTANPLRTRAATTDLGVPAAWSGLLGRVLGPLEVGCAVCLLVPPTAIAGAWLILLLLLAFTLLLAGNLLQGRRPSCACFGHLSDARISWRSVGRNVVFAGMAAGVLGTGSAGTAPCRLGCYRTLWEDRATVSLILLVLSSVAVAVLGVQVVSLIAQAARVQVRLQALERRHHHDPAPHGGAAAGIAITGPGEKLLLFVADGCAACERLLDEMTAGDLTSDPTLVIVTPRPSARPDPPFPTVVDESGRLWKHHRITYTPTVVRLDGNGEVGRAVGYPAAHDAVFLAPPAMSAAAIDMRPERTVQK